MIWVQRCQHTMLRLHFAGMDTHALMFCRINGPRQRPCLIKCGGYWPWVQHKLAHRSMN